MVPSTVRLFATGLLLFLFVVPCALAQTRGAETIREILREKIRWTPEQIRAVLAGREQQAEAIEAVMKPSDVAAAESAVSGGTDVEAEVHAAINPLDTNNIIVSPIRVSGSGGNGLLCPVYYTKDFGRTWRKSQFQTTPKVAGSFAIGGGDPILTFDNNGTAYLVWISLEINPQQADSIRGGLFWASSTDGGVTWRRTENDGLAIGAISLATQEGVLFDKEWLSVDRSGGPRRNTVYAAFLEANSATGASTIVVRRMVPGSGAFTAVSVPVSTEEFEMVQFAGIDVDLQGIVHATFFGSKSTANGYGMWHARSADGGETFSDPVKVSDVFLSRFNTGASVTEVVGIDAQRQYTCPQLAVDNSNTGTRGNLYLTWTAEGLTSKLGHGLDIYFSRSVDGGATWSAPIVVNSDARGIVRHQHYSSISISPAGAIALTWYDRRFDAANSWANYYIAYSFDGGQSFTAGAPVNSSPMNFSAVGSRNNGFGIGEYTQVLTTSGYAIPVWTDGRKNSGDLDIYAAVIPITRDVAAVERVGNITEHLVAGDPVMSGEMITLAFHLDVPASMHLSLYDIQGRIVTGSAREELEAGDHTRTLTTKGLAQGTYLLRLETSVGVVVRRISLVK